jgi:hypothetical protein
MVRAFLQSILAVLGLATMLSGCAAEPLSDRLPAEWGGLPAGTPARPPTPYQYPAVHDMPPARSIQPMSEEEQVKLEKDLATIRDRQEGREAPAKKAAPPALKNKASTVATAPPADAKTAAPAPKKKPTAVIVVPPAGVKANP